MRQQKKMKLLVFSISLMFLTMFFIAPVAAAVEEEDYPIILENFNITSNARTENEHAISEIIGKSIKNFKNVGIIERTDSTIKFSSTLDLECQIAYYTDYDLENIYSSVSKNPITKQWLDLESDPNWVDGADRVQTNLYTTFYSYSFGANKAPGINSIYDINVDFISFEDAYLEATNSSRSDIKISSPQISVLEMRAHDAETHQLDTYQDIFSASINQIKLDAIDVRTNELSSDNTRGWQDDVKEDLVGKISALKIGVTQDTIKTEPIQSGYQIKKSGVLVKSGVNQYQISIRNRPELLNYYNTITVRKGTLDVDTQDGVILKDAQIRYCAPVYNDTTKRIAGYRVNNFVLIENITIKVALFSEIQMSAADQEYYLGYTEFQKGDIIWDISLLGDTGASLIFTEKYNPNEDLWWIYLIIAAVAAVAIYIVLRIYAPGLFGGGGRRSTSVKLGDFSFSKK